MRWPLRYQILLPFAGAMLAVVLGVSLLDAYLAARRTQRQIAGQLHEVAQTLLDGNFPLTDAVLKQTRGLSGAEFLLTDPQGRVAASSLDHFEATTLPREAGVTQPFDLGSPIEVGGQPYFHKAIALRPRGVGGGPQLLHILYPERHLREARWQAAYPPLLVGTALLVVVIALAILIAGRLSRPIVELGRELGRLVHGQFRPLPIPKRNDELRDLVGTVNQLGDQLDELRRAIKRSERLALLGQLSGGLAHQLRNSATGARLAVQLHQRHCHDIDQDSLAVALRQLSITEAHLRSFLTAGQIAEPRRASCDLRNVVGDVAALLTPACAHHRVALRINADTAPPCLLSADADQLRQLLLNLTLNAIEAAGSGGWVSIELDSCNQAAMVQVSDSGPGPAPEIVERLFEPFATTKPEGIGLGLAVARKIAEAHRGSIRYTKGGATCFEVLLPMEHPAGTEAAPPAEQGAPHAASPVA